MNLCYFSLPPSAVNLDMLATSRRRRWIFFIALWVVVILLGSELFNIDVASLLQVQSQTVATSSNNMKDESMYLMLGNSVLVSETIAPAKKETTTVHDVDYRPEGSIEAISSVFRDPTTRVSDKNETITAQVEDYPHIEATDKDGNFTVFEDPTALVSGENETLTVQVEDHPHEAIDEDGNFSFVPDPKAMDSVQNESTTVVGNIRDHPHAGATDEDGNFGFVHDPTVIAESKVQFSIPPEELKEICALPGAGPEGIGGYRLITEKIRVSDVVPQLKIFCSVYSSPENEDMRTAIAETWGGHCDGYLAATTYTDMETGTVNVRHLGEESYGNIWQKVRSIWAYVHDNFLDSYDFFHINGDDTFVIVENMRSFLQSKKVEEDAGGPGFPLPLYIGFPVGDKRSYFNGGGSGYTLNKAALKLLVQEGFPICDPLKVDSAEDILIADCFRRFNVTGYGTLDAAGELRYNNEPNFIYNLNFSNPTYMSGNMPANFLFGTTHKDWPLKGGLEGASNETVTFHHIKPASKVRRIYKLLYRQNVADCSPDGQNEPGKIMPEEYYSALPHNNCSWSYNYGGYRECPFELYTEYQWPHAQAIDEDGNFGFVHDPSVIAESKVQFSIPPEELKEVCAPPGAGPEGIGGYRLITEKIKVSNVTQRLKIFCSVYSSPENEDMRKAIAETWGGHCDGYLAATTYTDMKTGTVNVPHLGEETYGNIWQKVRSIWAYVHDNFLDSYDFFHINGDDTFVIVENMRSFLQSKKVEEDSGGPGYPLPLYVGFPVGDKSNYFNGGGSGYTLNKAALKLLVREGFPVCEPFMADSAEDILVADCFRRFNVMGYGALDAAGELLYNNEPNFIYNLNFSDPTYMSANMPANFLFETTHKDWPLKGGLEGASNETVTFHHIKPASKVRRIYKLLYRQNVADCSPDGQNEPGKIMPEEYYSALPHNNCSWSYNYGGYRECPFELYTEYNIAEAG